MPVSKARAAAEETAETDVRMDWKSHWKKGRVEAVDRTKAVVKIL